MMAGVRVSIGSWWIRAEMGLPAATKLLLVIELNGDAQLLVSSKGSFLLGLMIAVSCVGAGSVLG
jgi:hypothetical protein